MVKVTVLLENTCTDERCQSEHGLSLLLETPKHKILSDAGATDLFYKNSVALGCDLSDVDLMVLSHGHYDHGGGIPAFCRINDGALIMMQKTAVLDYYGTSGYSGIDKGIASLPRVRFIDGDLDFDPEVKIFANVTTRRAFPRGNLRMTVIKNGVRLQDNFDHEQYLVICDGSKKILVSGCAHNGILNILDKFKQLYNCYPDVVISGFHMMKNVHVHEEFDSEDIAIINQTAEELSKMPTVFYTGHCTGKEAFEILKTKMNNLKALSTGLSFCI